MSDFIPMKIKFISSFDILPNEILHIFDYLTSNDIIYSFIHCNQRLQNLLVIQKYHFNLPKTNLNFWKKILPLIGPQIQTLSINTYDLTISLDFFSNLTSIIISSQYFLLDEQLLSILNHPYFRQLHIFKIKNVILDDEETLLKTIFHINNKLQIFEYQPKKFHDIFTLIRYTSNLIYLNIRSEILDREFKEYTWNNIDEINLEEFHLTFTSRTNLEYSSTSLTTSLAQLFPVIQIFSSSLITLSLNFSNIYLIDQNNILTNGIELEKKLLEPLGKLQKFSFYVGISQCKDAQQILSTIRRLQDFLVRLNFHHFRNVRSNNDEFLKQNNRLWSKVTSLHLVSIDQIDFKHLLSLITFYGGFSSPNDSYDEIECVNNLQLDSVPTTTLVYSSINLSNTDR
ncbi:unnamed protein product [Adineta ricciae]|uniref:Uncharacterized protein n=1 Tax=Adineta ricciae TaxID=249248 RepID=A0A815WPM2_ADIRI|nr:unnamed protein product [Adineta ricciae]CAF1602037.1 unnamed protein product [Adineta ricciae]